MIQTYPPSVSIELILKKLHEQAAEIVAARDNAPVENIAQDQITDLVRSSVMEVGRQGLLSVRVGTWPQIVVDFDLYGNIDTHDYDLQYGQGKTTSAISTALEHSVRMTVNQSPCQYKYY